MVKSQHQDGNMPIKVKTNEIKFNTLSQWDDARQNHQPEKRSGPSANVCTIIHTVLFPNSSVVRELPRVLSAMLRRPRRINFDAMHPRLQCLDRRGWEGHYKAVFWIRCHSRLGKVSPRDVCHCVNHCKHDMWSVKKWVVFVSQRKGSHRLQRV